MCRYDIEFRLTFGSVHFWSSDNATMIISDIEGTYLYQQQPDGVLGNIGLIKLTNPLPYTDTIRPVCLPQPITDLRKFKVCVITGFGSTNDGRMYYLLCEAYMLVAAM